MFITNQTENNQKNPTKKTKNQSKIEKIGFFFFFFSAKIDRFGLIFSSKIENQIESNRTEFMPLYSNNVLTNMMQLQKYPCVMCSTQPSVFPNKP